MALVTTILFAFYMLNIEVNGLNTTTYEANWESLDKRPVSSWFEDAKFGIFVHWGVYSVPSWHSKDMHGVKSGRYAGKV